ncbi:hypothetical protein [Edwardsiella ictaluri]|uniref:Uncharacterized protein n=2 Tax=Edwardsiella ictaluri TaxID=67780 RepID=C5BCX4_EDWI9|nr:hypothetical protein NT01EI_0338 [Edwardsiella ictaluri 93-146]
MANIAARARAVVIKGTELAHFENEVFSWHRINNQNGDEILPAVLITNAHPDYFMENSHGYKRETGLYRESKNNELKLILIPLKKFCPTTSDAISLIEKVFSDIKEGKDLSDFRIAKKAQKGIGSAIVDSIILEPNIGGIGFKLNQLLSFLRKDK